jgi:putative iron-only hydrogenase system regulator
MEKRIGVIAILLEDTTSVPALNSLLSGYAGIILARQGLPLRDKGVHIISLIVEGHTDQIGALTGKIGLLPGAQVKSVLTRYKESDDDADSPLSP